MVAIERRIESERAMFPTDHDIKSAVEEFRAMQVDFESYDGPVDMCLSVGYVRLWNDGEVTGGPVSFTVDSDGRAEK